MSQTKNIDTDMLKLTEEHNTCHFAHKYKTLYIQKETSFLTETLDFYTFFTKAATKGYFRSRIKSVMINDGIKKKSPLW